MKYLVFFCMLGTVYANTVYKYIDRDGNVVYTNTPIHGATQAKLPALSSYSQTAVAKAKSNPVTYTMPKQASQGNSRAGLNPASYRSSTTLASAGGSFPTIDTQTQKNRDLSRRGILVQELSSEEKALAEARRFLDLEAKASAMPAEQLQRYKNAILDHEKNIVAIRNEMGRL